MSATTPTTRTTATARGLTLPCPRCGEAAATFDFCLGDGETFHCQECDESITIDEVRLIIGRWTRAVAWADAMPTDDGE